MIEYNTGRAYEKLQLIRENPLMVNFFEFGNCEDRFVAAYNSEEKLYDLYDELRSINMLLEEIETLISVNRYE